MAPILLLPRPPPVPLLPSLCLPLLTLACLCSLISHYCFLPTLGLTKHNYFLPPYPHIPHFLSPPLCFYLPDLSQLSRQSCSSFRKSFPTIRKVRCLLGASTAHPALAHVSQNHLNVLNLHAGMGWVWFFSLLCAYSPAHKDCRLMVFSSSDNSSDSISFREAEECHAEKARQRIFRLA